MLIGSMSFAVMATLTHAVGAAVDWRIIALTRTFLAMVFAAGLALTAGARLVFLRPPTLWIRSIAGSISLVCTFYAFTRLPVSDVLTLTNVFPLWVALLSWPLTGRRPSLGVWLSIAGGIAGIVLIQQPHFEEGNFATVAALFSSLTTAIAMLGLNRLKKIDARAIVVHFSGTSLVFCIVSLFIGPNPVSPDQQISLNTLTLLLGVGATATVGQIFLTKAFVAGAPAKVSVVGLSQIVFAMILDIIVWNRDIEWWTLLGMVLVMAPTAWLMLHPRRITGEPPAKPV
jgi:drug/metabolite transporter (DMT)-like permease